MKIFPHHPRGDHFLSRNRQKKLHLSATARTSAASNCSAFQFWASETLQASCGERTSHRAILTHLAALPLRIGGPVGIEIVRPRSLSGGFMVGIQAVDNVEMHVIIDNATDS